ncbi:Holliday junction resolvase RuvX [soil metagenome]
MRTLALDYGTLRVGLAQSDEGGHFATPVEVIAVSAPELAIEPIVKFVREEGIERLVVGLPLNMDDSIGPSAREAIAWGKQIAERAGKPLVFVDERLSSFITEQRFNDRKRAGAKMTRGQKKDRLDAHAAADFLQAFLDGKLPAIDVDL